MLLLLSLFQVSWRCAYFSPLRIQAKLTLKELCEHFFCIKFQFLQVLDISLENCGDYLAYTICMILNGLSLISGITIVLFPMSLYSNQSAILAVPSNQYVSLSGD
jgi:hypothetical protein